jgi:hypothetical protein
MNSLSRQYGGISGRFDPAPAPYDARSCMLFSAIARGTSPAMAERLTQAGGRISIALPYSPALE